MGNPRQGDDKNMTQALQQPPERCPECHLVVVARRVVAPCATLVAIALASLCAFLALVWLDGLIQVFNPATFRLGPAKHQTIDPLPFAAQPSAPIRHEDSRASLPGDRGKAKARGPLLNQGSFDA